MATATLLPLPRAVFTDANGAPLQGGFVYTYVPGGTTPKLTWQDPAETTPNQNPVQLDADGSCLLYGSGIYQLTVTDCLGNSVPTYSGITSDTALGAGISVVMQPIVSAATLNTAWALFANITATGQFYENDGAIIGRLNDRIMIGGATINDCDNPNLIQDWLTQQTGLGWPVFTAQLAVLSTTNQIAITAGTRTSDQAPSGDNEGNGAGISIGTWAINDYSAPTNTRDAWGLYVEARHAQQNQGVTWGMELDIMAYGGHLQPATPYDFFVAYGAYGMDIASGAGQPNANDATAAIQIGNNGAKFLSGIIFQATALTGADGTASSGSAEAIAMARGQCINWYNDAGVKAATIESLCTSNTGFQALTFTDVGLSYASAGQSIAGFATSTPTLGTTNFSVLIHNTASGVTFQNVFLGPADSAGTGSRALAVPN